MDRLQTVQGQLVKPSKFRYTVDGGCLTEQQRQFYEENGYLIIKNFLKDADIERWTKRFLEYCDRKIEKIPSIQIIRDISLVRKGGKDSHGEAAITKVQNFNFDDELFSYCNNPDIIPYIKSFCGPDIKSVHTMFLNKPPHMGTSSRHPFHQDLAYFPFRPADKIVTAWSALEDVTRDNGCLNVFPGSHKGEFLKHIYPQWEGMVNKAYFGIDKYQETSTNHSIRLEMKKGDMVLFHSLLIHGSGENKTQGFRKSLSCHYASSACKYIDIKGTFHEQVANEILSYAIKRYAPLSEPGMITYQDLWHENSRLVAGQEYKDGV